MNSSGRGSRRIAANRRGALAVSAFLFGANLIFGASPLLKSTDGGATWVEIDPGAGHLGVADLQISGSRLYALTVTRVESVARQEVRDFSVITSSDGGRSWQVLDRLGSTRGFAAMAVSPSDPDTVYVLRVNTVVGSGGVDLVRTTDRGDTVSTVSYLDALGPFNMYPTWCSLGPAYFGVHPARAATIFMGFDCIGDSVDPFQVFLLSRDGGSTWLANSPVEWLNTYLPIGARMRGLAATKLLADPLEPTLVYARNRSIRTGLYLARSVDNGETWSGPLLEDVSTAALKPGNPAVLFASKVNGSMWHSTDRGESWRHLANLLPLDRITIHGSSIRAQPAPLLHQESTTGDILRSEDGGETWSVIPTGLDGYLFVFDPGNPGTVYGTSWRRNEVRLRPPYVRNLAGGSMLVPASLFSVYGDDLAGEVKFNGVGSDLFFVSRRQINGRVPPGVKPGLVTVEVSRAPQGGPTTVDQQSATLSSFPAPVILHDSAGRPHFYHSQSNQQVTEADPASPGEAIVVYCTGLGESWASTVQYLQMVERPNDALIARAVSPVPDQPGVFRVIIDVPATLGPGSYTVILWGGRNFARLAVGEQVYKNVR
jgi:uncharacterized protein (TIGR03437 family)